MTKETGLILLLCVSIAGVSFWLGRSFQEGQPVTVHTIPDESHFAALKKMEQKMRQISEGDYTDYLRLKDRKAQYEKAEEILAKIMQIFVADLGLRLSKGDREKMPAKKTDASMTEAAPASAPKRKAEAPHAAPAKPPGGEAFNWKVMEARLPDVRDDSDADKFLKSVSVDNLFSAIRDSRPAGTRNLREMNGEFFGQIRFADAGRKPKDVHMSMELKTGPETPEGNYKIIISQDGKDESHTSGAGKFDHYYTTGDSAAILVRATPNSYAQLYWSPQLNQFFGNYYNMDAVDRYSPVGVIFLRRQ